MQLAKKIRIFDRSTSDEWQLKAIITTTTTAKYKLQSLKSGETITLSKKEFKKSFECKPQSQPADLTELLTRMALHGPF